MTVQTVTAAIVPGDTVRHEVSQTIGTVIRATERRLFVETTDGDSEIWYREYAVQHADPFAVEAFNGRP